MSLSSSKGVLTDAVKSLRVSWQRCNTTWLDHNAEQFERDFLSRIDPAARQACDAMDHLRSACDEARRACE
jgi:hypothetical protein